MASLKQSILTPLLLVGFALVPLRLFATSAPGREPIQPIPEKIELDERKVALGEELFHDKGLSKDGTISCASCHSLSRGGVDGRRFSRGVGGKEGNRNSPTVFNSGLNFRQFWDGRAESLEDQIDGPVNHPNEMGSSWPEVVKKLQRRSLIVSEFEQIYDDGVNAANIKDAIATFERSLITPHARFDKFLRGDTTAITDREKKGYELFKSYGCVSCHQGTNVGGNMFQKFGVVENYSDATRETLFKVPSLRNVELTAPYFHDGSAVSLEEAVRTMARYQLGRALTEADVKLIVEFLKSLTGTYRGKPLGPARK